MRQARLRDLRRIVFVVGDAFTRDCRGASRPTARRRRALTTWTSELAAVLSREALVNDERDVVVHVGRRGTLRAAVRAYGPLSAVVLMAVATIVALTTPGWWAIARAGHPGLAFIGFEVTIIIVGIVLAVLLAAGARTAETTGAPSAKERRYRHGVSGEYWLVSTLAAMPRPGQAAATAMPFLTEQLSTVLRPDMTLVAVAADARLHVMYRRAGFAPLGDSPWVLVRHATSDQRSAAAPTAA